MNKSSYLIVHFTRFIKHHASNLLHAIGLHGTCRRLYMRLKCREFFFRSAGGVDLTSESREIASELKRLIRERGNQ